MEEGKEIMKRRSKILFEVILYMALILLTYYISHYIYADAYNMRYAARALTLLIVSTLTEWRKEGKNLRPKWEVYVVLGIVIIVFLATKPKYTYEQGKELLKEQNFTGIESFEDRSLISFKLDRNYFIQSSYLYIGDKNGEKYYLQVHPKSGEIDSLKVGEGNYIDNYLKLKKEKANSSKNI